jgi:hypothetical protein
VDFPFANLLHLNQFKIKYLDIFTQFANCFFDHLLILGTGMLAKSRAIMPPEPQSLRAKERVSTTFAHAEPNKRLILTPSPP